jgi:hypothetical protein
MQADSSIDFNFFRKFNLNKFNCFSPFGLNQLLSTAKVQGLLPGRSGSQSQSASQRRGNASEMNEFDVSVSLYIYMHFFPSIFFLYLSKQLNISLTSFLLVVSLFGSIFKFLFGLIIYRPLLFLSLFLRFIHLFIIYLFDVFLRLLLLKKKIDGGRLLSEAKSSNRSATAGFHRNNTRKSPFF